MSKKVGTYRGFALVVLIFAVILVEAGCNRKIGVSPDGNIKTSKSKCKCKKNKVGIYTHFHSQKATFNNFCSARIDMIG